MKKRNLSKIEKKAIVTGIVVTIGISVLTFCAVFVSQLRNLQPYFAALITAVTVFVLMGLLVYFSIKDAREHINGEIIAEEELKGKDNLIESMRIVNHDFMNKMHILMGYLETGRYDDAKKFIYDIKSVPTKEISKITERVANPQLSALIVGKMIRGKEIGIRVHVLSASDCKQLTEGIGEDEYTTIIGNLIENSLEELNATTQEEKVIDVCINTNFDWSFISVTDNGRGIEEVERVFEMGYSTKGTNRGIGMPIIRQIANKHNGNVEVDSARHEGCTITVSMQRKKLL